MQNKHGITLYNVLFPVWLLVWIPSYLWLLLIPLNYILDYYVLFKSLAAGMQRKHFCDRHTWKICAAGFTCDFLGSLLLLAVMMLSHSSEWKIIRETGQGISFNPFSNAFAFFTVVLAILLSAFCIYQADFRILKRAGLTEGQSKKSALWLAVITAPYLFLLPAEVLYRNM